MVSHYFKGQNFCLVITLRFLIMHGVEFMVKDENCAFTIAQRYCENQVFFPKIYGSENI